MSRQTLNHQIDRVVASFLDSVDECVRSSVSRAGFQVESFKKMGLSRHLYLSSGLLHYGDSFVHAMSHLRLDPQAFGFLYLNAAVRRREDPSNIVCQRTFSLAVENKTHQEAGDELAAQLLAFLEENRVFG